MSAVYAEITGKGTVEADFKLDYDMPDHTQQFVGRQPSKTDSGRSCHFVWGPTHRRVIKEGNNVVNHKCVNPFKTK